MKRNPDIAESQDDPKLPDWAHITRARVLQVLEGIARPKEPKEIEIEKWEAAIDFVRSALRQTDIDIYVRKSDDTFSKTLPTLLSNALRDHRDATGDSEIGSDDIVIQSIRKEILIRLQLQFLLGCHPKLKTGLKERLEEIGYRFKMKDLKDDKRTSFLFPLINNFISTLSRTISRKQAYEFIINFIARCIGQPIEFSGAYALEGGVIRGTPKTIQTRMIYNIRNYDGDGGEKEKKGDDEEEQPPLKRTRHSAAKTSRQTPKFEDPFASFRSRPMPPRSKKVQAEMREKANYAAEVDDMMLRATGSTGRRR